MHKVIIKFILILIFFSFCTTADETTNNIQNDTDNTNKVNNQLDINFEPILSDDEEEEVLTNDKLIDRFSFLKSKFIAPKPIIADNEFIGEAYILTNKEYYAYLNHIYNIGEMNLEEYKEELMNAYLNSDDGNFNIVISIWTENEVYANPENWSLQLEINGNIYESFIPSDEYIAPYLPYYIDEIDRKYSDNELYEFGMSFTLNLLPEGSRPYFPTPITMVSNITLNMYYEYSPETLTVQWNNIEFYYYYDIHNKVDNIILGVMSEIPNTPVGNSVEFKYVKEFIPFGIKDVFLDMSLDNFPYDIPNYELGLLPATVYNISSFLDHDEYITFHKVRYVLYYLSYYTDLDFADYVTSRSVNKKYLLKRNILFEVMLIFNDYLTERRLVNVPEDDPLRNDFMIEKIGFMVRDNSIIALSFFFGDEVNTGLIKELTSIFGEEKTINPRQPYAWNDRSRRLIYSSDSRALHFVNNNEVIEMVDTLERFLRFFSYNYESYFMN